MKRLVKKYHNYALSISVTTRSPRAGELHGREYYFKSPAEFKQLIAADALIEYACYVGNYYGTPFEYVEKQLSSGKDVLLEIETQGALKVKAKLPETLLLFVSPPSLEELRERLTKRGTETPEMIESRLKRAIHEAKEMKQYDYLLINNDLEACVDTTHGIIQSAHYMTAHNRNFIAQIQNDLKQLR